MVNRVELIGNLTADPELHYAPSGAAYCHIRLATNRTTRSGEHAEFHYIVAWHAVAEAAAKYLQLGDRAYVEGRLETNRYTDKDGRQVQRSRVVANRVLAMERHKERVHRFGKDAEPSAEATSIANAIAASHVGEDTRREPAEEPA